MADKTKPSMLAVSFSAAFGDIRENQRAAYECDPGWYNRATGDYPFEFSTSDSAGAAYVFAKAGNGTTSSRNIYLRLYSIETTPQDWRVGMLASLDWKLQNFTRSTVPLFVKQSNDFVGIGGTPLERLHVFGNVLAEGQIYLRGANNSSIGLQIQNAAGVQHWMMYENTGPAGEQGVLLFRDQAANINALTIAGGGAITTASSFAIAGGTPITKHVSATAAWTPGTIAAGAQVTATVTVAGAALGMTASAGFSLDIQGAQLTAHISGANTAVAVLRNGNAGPITIGAGTLRIDVTGH